MADENVTGESAPLNPIAASLRELCIDWNGEPIVDGSTPRSEPTCGALRGAADEIERLHRCAKDNNTLARMNGDHRDKWRAKAVVCMEALEIVSNGDVDVSDTAIIVGNGASTVILQLRDALAAARGEQA